jgi:hypothetical protein
VAKISDVIILEADIAVTAADIDSGGDKCDIFCTVKLVAVVLRIIALVVLFICDFKSCWT